MNAEDRAKLLTVLPDYSNYSTARWGHLSMLDRFTSGDLRIDIGPSNWPGGWYTDPHWKVSVPFALGLIADLPEVNDVKIYYFKLRDYHHIEFTFRGETYIAQWYKVWVLHRKSDKKHLMFGHRSHEIMPFLRSPESASSPHWYPDGCMSPWGEDNAEQKQTTTNTQNA